MANKTLLFIQLAALLAVTCAQHQQPHQGSVESSELLRRRQEFQQASRLQSTETAQNQQARLQAEFERSVDLANKAQLAQMKQAQHVGAAVTNRQQFPTPPTVVNAPKLAQAGKVQTRVQSAIDSEDELFRKQAASAHYSFNAAINDGINDNVHIREESRDGLKVSGVYSYSDGFYKRTVFYEADEDGYRVVKEEVDPIGNGPKIDLAGSADVSTKISGVESQYRITTADISRGQKEKIERDFDYRN